MTSHRCELPAPVVLGRYNLVEGAYWQASEASIRPLSTCIRTNGRFVTPLRAGSPGLGSCIPCCSFRRPRRKTNSPIC